MRQEKENRSIRQAPLYLDDCSTAPMTDKVKATLMAAIQRDYKNPSSLHREGLEAEKAIDEARLAVARLLHTEPGHIFFTSGGTEANSAAIRQGLRRGKTAVITATDHPSVVKAVQDVAENVMEWPVDSYAALDPEFWPEKEPDLLVITQVHNELGTVRPVEAIARAWKSRYPQVHIHVDAVQAFGKLPVNPEIWDVDSVAVSGHKIGGPKGVGALYIREPHRWQPWQPGGGQEKGLRAGTENILGIIGMGAAAAERLEMMDRDLEQVKAVRETFLDTLQREVDGGVLQSPVQGSPYVLSLSFPGIRGEVILHMLEEDQIYVSTGSACSARSLAKDSVLQKAGISPQAIEGTLRFCLNPSHTREDMKRAAKALARAVERYRKLVNPN